MAALGPLSPGERALDQSSRGAFCDPGQVSLRPNCLHRDYSQDLFAFLTAGVYTDGTKVTGLKLLPWAPGSAGCRCVPHPRAFAGENRFI